MRGDRHGVGIVAAAAVLAVTVGYQIRQPEASSSELVAIAGIALICGLAVQAVVRLVGPHGGQSPSRAVARPRRAWGRALRGFASMTFVFALGLVATEPPRREISPREPPSLAGPALVAGVVQRASTPGPRCSVRVSFAGAVWLLRTAPEFCPLARGDEVIVRADELRAAPVTTPGAAPAAAVAMSYGVHRVAYVDRIWRRPRHRVGSGRAVLHACSRTIAKLRHAAWDWSRGDDGRALVIGASLGISRALPPEQTRALRASGLSHLLAVSGLHVGFAFTMVFATLVTLFGGAGRRGVEVASGLGVVVLAGYVVLTGFSPSVVRAALTRVLVVWSHVRGFRDHALQRLSWVVVAMLLARPGWILAPGFQLSVAASFALSTMAGRGSLLRATVRITVFTAPLCWLHFGDAVFAGLVANLVAVPYFSLVLAPMILLGWLLTPIIGLDGLIPASWAAEWLLSFAGSVAMLPEVSWRALAGALGFACVLERVVRRWRPAVPLGSLCLGFVPTRHVATMDPGGVIVVSGARHRSVASLSARGLCVHALDFRVGQTATLFEGVARAHGAPVSVGARDGPHVREFIRSLRHANLEVRRVASCPPVDERRVGEVVDGCRARYGRAVVAHVGDSGEAWCVVDGRWTGIFSRREASSDP